MTNIKYIILYFKYIIYIFFIFVCSGSGDKISKSDYCIERAEKDLYLSDR